MTDEQLVEQFFQSQQTALADDGFSDRVMQTIGQQKAELKYQRIWMIVCIALGVLWFLLSGGLNGLSHSLVHVYSNLTASLLNIFYGLFQSLAHPNLGQLTPLTLLLSLFILAFVVYRDLKTA